MFLALRDTIQVVKWAPRKKALGAAGANGTFYLYDPRKNVRIRQFAPSDSSLAHRSILSIGWSSSPTERKVALGGGSGLVEIWSLEKHTETLCSSYNEHSPEIRRLPFASDPRRRTIYAVAWSPNLKYLASAGEDTAVRVWNARTGETHCVTVDEPRRAGFLLTWLNDTTLVSAGTGEVVVWHAFTGQVLRVFDTPELRQDWQNSRYVSPEKTRLAVAAGAVTIYDLTTGQPVRTYANPWLDNPGPYYSHHPSQTVWAPNGRWMATSFASSPKNIVIWDVLTGETLLTLKSIEAVHCLDWSADSSMLGWGGNGYLQTAAITFPLVQTPSPTAEVSSQVLPAAR